jgi:Pentapeptide repeats (8 copies)
VQATPTEDATVTALNKEKLEQEVEQLKKQNELNLFTWLQANTSLLLSTLVIVIGGLIGLWRWLGDRRDEHEKRRQDQQSEQERRAEERFQAAVAGLIDEKEAAKISAAILLRTFLRPSYEQFYTQIFDLAVANLRLPRIAAPPADPTLPLPLTTLSQALIVVFKEAFPLARGQETKSPQSLDATGIQLDNAYLSRADLKQVWMPQALLRKANLREANLCKAILNGANLNGANLIAADLNGAYLIAASLREADIRQANLIGTNLRGADLGGASLSGTNLENTLSLNGTNLRGVKGLTKEQLETYKAKGAIIDEDTKSSSSQSSIPPPPSMQL